MGMEIQVDSLEDMCALMCDNVIPEGRRRMKNKEIEEARKIISLYIYDLDLPKEFIDAISVLFNATKESAE